MSKITSSMRAALIVNPVGPDIEHNLAAIHRAISNAAAAGASLVVLGEAATTGLINNDDPSHDLPLGRTAPGPITNELSGLARLHNVWIAIGLLEREDGRLYDSALLLRPDGVLALRHRRTDPNWHGRQADPEIYRQGTEIKKVETPFGTVSFLICGELFSDEAINLTIQTRPDLILYLFARCFGDKSFDQTRWEQEVETEYAPRVRNLGAPVLAVSYFSILGLPEQGLAFGGAMAFAADGSVSKSFAIGQAGALWVTALHA